MSLIGFNTAVWLRNHASKHGSKRVKPQNRMTSERKKKQKATLKYNPMSRSESMHAFSAFGVVKIFKKERRG